MFKTIGFLALLLGSTNVYAADNSLYWPAALCTGVIDGVNFNLDIFAELTEESQAVTEATKGFVVQTMENTASGQSMKMMGRLDLKGLSESTMQVTMYALANPSVVFSTFTIDIEKPAKVEIFATGFGAVWGVFDCKPGFEGI